MHSNERILFSFDHIELHLSAPAIMDSQSFGVLVTERIGLESLAVVIYRYAVGSRGHLNLELPFVVGRGLECMLASVHQNRGAGIGPHHSLDGPAGLFFHLINALQDFCRLFQRSGVAAAIQRPCLVVFAVREKKQITLTFFRDECPPGVGTIDHCKDRSHLPAQYFLRLHGQQKDVIIIR